MKKRRRKNKTKKKRLSQRALDIILFGTPGKCCLNVDSVARELGVLPASLSRAFKRDFKCDLKQFLLETKLTWSILLLMNLKLSTKEVAAYLDFESHWYFKQLYRDYFGTDPEKAHNYYMVFSGIYLLIRTKIIPKKNLKRSNRSTGNRRKTRTILVPLPIVIDNKTYFALGCGADTLDAEALSEDASTICFHGKRETWIKENENSCLFKKLRPIYTLPQALFLASDRKKKGLDKCMEIPLQTVSI